MNKPIIENLTDKVVEKLKGVIDYEVSKVLHNEIGKPVVGSFEVSSEYTELHKIIVQASVIEVLRDLLNYKK